MLRRSAGPLSALFLLSTTALGFPLATEAHCLGDSPTEGWRAYASAQKSVPDSIGVKASIGWTNPNTCTKPEGNAISVEGITLAHYNSSGVRDAFIQTGWIKYQYWSAPKGYCEFSPPNPYAYEQLHYTLPSASTYTYKIERVYDTESRQNFWDCKLGSTTKYSRSTERLGMSSGSWVNAQGEVNSVHGQIGKMAPAELRFSSYSHLTGGAWQTTDLVPSPVYFPYGRSEPFAGGLDNWTNDH